MIQGLLLAVGCGWRPPELREATRWVLTTWAFPVWQPTSSSQQRESRTKVGWKKHNGVTRVTPYPLPGARSTSQDRPTLSGRELPKGVNTSRQGLCGASLDSLHPNCCQLMSVTPLKLNPISSCLSVFAPWEQQEVDPMNLKARRSAF